MNSYFGTNLSTWTKSATDSFDTVRYETCRYDRTFKTFWWRPVPFDNKNHGYVNIKFIYELSWLVLVSTVEAVKKVYNGRTQVSLKILVIWIFYDRNYREWNCCKVFFLPLYENPFKQVSCSLHLYITLELNLCSGVIVPTYLYWIIAYACNEKCISLS